MSPIDLSGDIATAVEGAQPAGRSFVVGYVDHEGKASLSFRGSVVVLGPDTLGLWVRDPAGAFVTSIAERPDVSLLYYSRETPGAFYLSIRGRARVDVSATDAVYDKMAKAEQALDAERKGAAIVIDVDSVRGASPDGPIAQTR